MEVEFQVILNLTLNGGGCSAKCFGRFTSREIQYRVVGLLVNNELEGIWKEAAVS